VEGSLGCITDGTEKSEHDLCYITITHPSLHCDARVADSFPWPCLDTPTGRSGSIARWHLPQCQGSWSLHSSKAFEFPGQFQSNFTSLQHATLARVGWHLLVWRWHWHSGILLCIIHFIHLGTKLLEDYSLTCLIPAAIIIPVTRHRVA
jgi:hypothetical protein